jgi:hypothetical protein
MTGRFRPPLELASRGPRGRPPARRPVRSSPTAAAGVSAKLDLFALALTGSAGRIHDGSLTECTADPSLPVEID